MLDLLHNAARMVRLHGRLVYLIPTTYDFTIDDLPKHPCFEIVSICEQPLSTRHGRRCVTSIKMRDYTVQLEDLYRLYTREILLGDDVITSVDSLWPLREGEVDRFGFKRLKHKLVSALSSSAFADDSITKHISNSCARRKESAMRKREAAIATNSQRTKREEGPSLDIHVIAHEDVV